MALNPSSSEGLGGSNKKLIQATQTDRSPRGSRESSPGPERLAVLQQDTPKRGASPSLPRKTLEELESREIRRREGDTDPDDPPLRTPWTFWFERSPTASSTEAYSQALKKIHTVNTIKQFFSVYNNLKPPNQLNTKECYHLMRTGMGEEPRKPLWEDPVNLDGGIWAFKCRKEVTVNVWLELLLAAIGEQFLDCTADGDDVVGITIRIRDYEMDTLQVWHEKATLVNSAKVVSKVREIVPNLEPWDHYSSIKDKLSPSRPHFPPNTHRSSSPPTFYSHPRPSHHTYQNPIPSRGGLGSGPRRGHSEYYHYRPGSRQPYQSGVQRFPSATIGSTSPFHTPSLS